MYVSMTGFGRAQLQRAWGTVNLEISSVNHRYQEITVRMPREFAGWEPWFHQKLRAMFRRGKVQVRVEVFWAQSEKRAQLNTEILKSYYKDILAVQKELDVMTEPRLELFASLPGVFDTPTVGEREEELKIEETFAELLNSGVRHWQSMRELEGAHLREEILGHLEKLEEITAKISEIWQGARDEAFAAVRNRISDVVESMGGKLEESRFFQEIAIMTDKWDVSEELARLKSHIAKFRMTGEEKNSVGRKLDFLTQEINREINTLDSKVADSNVRWLAVDAKAELEMIREQIQNLE